MRMMFVVQNLDTRVIKIINRLNTTVQLKLREFERISLYLFSGLFYVIIVKVTVPPSPDKFPRLEVTNLCNHTCQETV